MDMVYTGEPLTAQQALQWGLISRIVPQAELMNTAWAMAEKISLNSPAVVGGIKRATEAGLLDLPVHEAQRLWNVVSGGMMDNTADAQEGSRAFTQKRKSDFS